MPPRTFEYQFRFNAILLKLCGFLSFDSLPRILNFTITSFILSTKMFVLLPVVWGATTNWNRIILDDRMEILMKHGEVLCILFKVLVVIAHRRRISSLPRLCKNMWESIENDDEFRIMESVVKRGRYFSYFFACDICYCIAHLVIATALEESNYEENGSTIRRKFLIYPTGFVHRDDTLYRVLFAIQIPCTVISALCVMAIDAGVVVFVAHAIAHMRIVQFRIGNIPRCRTSVKSAENSINESSGHTEMMKRFRECVKHHQIVLTYCRELESAINPIMLLQAIRGMTATVFVATNLQREGSTKMQLVTFLLAAVSELLLCCWASEKLKNEGHAVAKAVYESLPWTSWSTSDRKLVHIMLMKAQEAVLLTGGKFITMSLLTFAEIISKAVSFFTVIAATT